ncbi:family 16 glycosylhydrolase [Acholeplasma laidlawii]|uniref:Laminarinase, glycosyl hydrolase family 16 member n=3 Tax=Acholeplasma laidlawii TaxID=2148 RepID=A9NG63_ACHLI|nr:glycoside hydrolase family 16 protein [Acholeplasma laidlawii]ABX81343.1 laminarinase, glycosyl hydrolase family 16 member [Acholeplasma laidlawii PG-8A]NWH11467.1 glycoside hydrolase family 16 protein [Acholeplasma laidlawii]NWH13123.1 glycoside hydrolase family 16 protein [Acholeplasma laidlawii]NWH14609.1 glycoside hydrolase family 16 protein [Acholeplasma laidlawii]OAN19632.1 hypothetical protein A2I99_05140 [Acholeplasma laidlawii]
MKKIVFYDHFDVGTKPNQTYWNIDVGGSGFGNNEDQFYTDRLDNIYIEDSLLHIVARKEDFEHRKYTSAKITTKNKVSIQYGAIEVRMKLPKGLGTWPAFWLLGDNIHKVGWPTCGEIDLMEYVGKEPDALHFSLHSKNFNHTKSNNLHLKKEIKNLSDDFHVYKLEWSKEGFNYYLDNELLFKAPKEDKQGLDNWPFDEPFFMIINLAIGGNWGGKIDDSIFPVEFLIDYVKVTS